MDWVEVAGRLRAAVALGLVVGGPGCGPVVDTEDGETGGSSSAASTSGTPITAASLSTTTGAEDTTTGTPTPVTVTGQDSGPRFDVGDMRLDIWQTPDFGEPQIDCEPVGGLPDCAADLQNGEILHPICIGPLGDASCDLVPEDEFFEAAWDCLGCSGSPERLECERTTFDDTTCCSWMVIRPGQSCPGRPFLVDGQARVARVVERDDWSRACAPRLEGLSASDLAVLSQAWAAEGCHEAASVASFSRFVLQLMSLGAPSSFIASAQAAIADEVSHARTFFGLARAYGGVGLGPDVLPIDGALDDASDPIACAVSLATEGCIAETVSAMQLSMAASRATDPEVAALLSEIAEQELRHAELAWSALSWMLQRGDTALRNAVADAFIHAEDAVPRAVSISDGLDPTTLRACGRLTSQQRLDVAHRALKHCVAPAAEALLRPWTVSAQPPAVALSARDRVVPGRA